LGDGNRGCCAGLVQALGEHGVQPGKEEGSGQVGVWHREFARFAAVLDEPAQQHAECRCERIFDSVSVGEQRVVQFLPVVNCAGQDRDESVEPTEYR